MIDLNISRHILQVKHNSLSKYFVIYGDTNPLKLGDLIQEWRDTRKYK